MRNKTIIIILVILCTGIVNLYAQYADHRNRKVDSLEHILQTNPPSDTKTLASMYRDLMWGYSECDNKKAMIYAQKAIDISSKENLLNLKSNSYRVMGMLHYGINSYDSAFYYLNHSLEACNQMNSDKRYNLEDIEDNEALIYGTMANIYNMIGELPQAVEYYTKALRIFEKYNWNHSKATVYLNLSELYRSMENYEMAKNYTLQLDSLAHLINDSLFIAKANIQLGQLYLNPYTDYEKAQLCADIAANYILPRPEEGSWKTTCLYLMASINIAKGDLNQAETYIKQGIELSDILGSPYDKASMLALQAKIHLLRKEYLPAIDKSLKALEYNEDEPEYTLSTYQILAEAYSYINQPEKAKEFFNKAIELQVLWSNRNFQSALTEQNIRYETGKKELLISSLEKEKQLMLVLAITGITLSILFLTLLFYLTRLHRHQKRIIATQVALKSEAAERQRLAKDLHDGLGGMLSLVKISIETGDNSKAETQLDNVITEMRRIAHHIMPESLTKHGLKTSLSDFAKAIPNTEFHFYGDEKRIDAGLEITLYRATYELINNAINHSSALKISIQLIQSHNRISLSVTDNGNGFDPSKQTHGIGLKNIQNRLSVYGGKMQIMDLALK